MKIFKFFLIKIFFLITTQSNAKLPIVKQKLEKKRKDYFYIKERLRYYNLIPTCTPPSYKYKTEILCGTSIESFKLDPKIERFAKSQNLRLNHSIFFNLNFLKKTKKVRLYHLKPKHFKQNVGQLLDVKTEDGKTISCTYFDRKSDKLLIIGGGFTNERELMSPFIDMFIDYDIILFDYRGHGYHQINFLDIFSGKLNLTKILFGANTKISMIGAVEEKDVFAVVDNLKKVKNYKQTIGLGICYSALIFVKAATIRQNEQKEKLFDKLILDGCWLSLENFIEKLMEDPKKICSPQKGGWKNNWIVKKRWFQKSLINIGQSLSSTKFNKISILDYLPKLKNIPILYFYGKDDIVINRHEFEIIWNATKVKEKTVVVTSNPHVNNHLKQKELYQMICDLFIELPHEKFINCFQNKNNLIQHYIDKLTSNLKH
ncbi:hypothetical protein KAT08_03270 [Candidatus Babeliales bacterium]|nr:hypothetical protein [Candidatus Babeliales bacterium]